MKTKKKIIYKNNSLDIINSSFDDAMLSFANRMAIKLINKSHNIEDPRNYIAAFRLDLKKVIKHRLMSSGLDSDSIDLTMCEIESAISNINRNFNRMYRHKYTLEKYIKYSIALEFVSVAKEKEVPFEVFTSQFNDAFNIKRNYGLDSLGDSYKNYNSRNLQMLFFKGKIPTPKNTDYLLSIYMIWGNLINVLLFPILFLGWVMHLIYFAIDKYIPEKVNEDRFINCYKVYLLIILLFPLLFGLVEWSILVPIIFPVFLLDFVNLIANDGVRIRNIKKEDIIYFLGMPYFVIFLGGKSFNKQAAFRMISVVVLSYASVILSVLLICGFSLKYTVISYILFGVISDLIDHLISLRKKSILKRNYIRSLS